MRKLLILLGIVFLLIACAGVIYTPPAPECENTPTPENTEIPSTSVPATVVVTETPEVTKTTVVTSLPPFPPKPPKPHKTLVPPEEDQDKSTIDYISPVTGSDGFVRPINIFLFFVGLVAVYVGLRGLFGRHK